MNDAARDLNDKLSDKLSADLAELETAEDFLDYFAVAYDPALVQVCRLHILQRFHDYLGAYRDGGAAGYADYRRSLTAAYADFVRSDVLTEKVFSVHRRAAGIATVPVAAIGRGRH